MRYPASEKLEIIRLVEESHVSARRALAKLGIPRTTFYRPLSSLHAATAGQWDITVTILMGGGDGAAFTMMEMVVERGMGAPARISLREDKVFHVSKDPFLFLIGEAQVEANERDHLFVGKCQVHSFSAQCDEPAQMTLVSTPAHHGRFFRAFSALPRPHEPQDARLSVSRGTSKYSGRLCKVEPASGKHMNVILKGYPKWQRALIHQKSGNLLELFPNPSSQVRERRSI